MSARFCVGAANAPSLPRRRGSPRALRARHRSGKLCGAKARSNCRTAARPVGSMFLPAKSSTPAAKKSRCASAMFFAPSLSHCCGQYKASTLFSVVRRAAAAAQVAGGIDETDVRKCLRKVSDQAPAFAVVFFRAQPDIVADREQPLEYLPGFRVPPLEREIVGEPEGAGDECAFAGRKTVNLRRFGVAVDEAAVHEPLFDRFDSAEHARIGRSEERRVGKECRSRWSP